MSKSVLKMSISGLKISMSGLKISISGLTISISGLKTSLFGFKITKSRVRARSQTLAPIFPSGRFITTFATSLENPFSSRRKMSTPPKREPKKRKSKVSFRNSKNSFHSAQQQKSQIRIYSGSFSLTPTDNSTGARSTADRQPSAPTRPRCPPTTSQKTPDRHQASTLKSHKSVKSDAINRQINRQEEDPKQKGTQIHKKPLKGVTPRDHRVTTQKAPQNRDKASTTLTHPTTTHTRPLKGGTPHILHFSNNFYNYLPHLRRVWMWRKELPCKLNNSFHLYATTKLCSDEILFCQNWSHMLKIFAILKISFLLCGSERAPV